MKDPRLERELARAGSQWKDEDLDEILALLDKDYTKPQPKPQPVDELDELKALLDKDYTKAEPEKAPHFPPLFGGEPLPEEPEQEPVAAPVAAPVAEPVPTDAEEETFEETAVPTLGEQADFTQAPAKPEDPRKERIRLAVLTAVAALELVGIVAIALWWRQWVL
jgi:hypothetical protein